MRRVAPRSRGARGLSAARDGRRVNLGLTPRGREVHRPTARPVEDVVERLVRQMRSDELATTKAVLRRLTELLHAEADSP